MDTFVTSIERLAQAEGETKGQRKLVVRLLTRKVGTIDATVRERVEALAPESLLTLSEALLDFTTPNDLVAWLDAAAPHG